MILEESFKSTKVHYFLQTFNMPDFKALISRLKGLILTLEHAQEPITQNELTTISIRVNKIISDIGREIRTNDPIIVKANETKKTLEKEFPLLNWNISTKQDGIEYSIYYTGRSNEYSLVIQYTEDQDTDDASYRIDLFLSDISKSFITIEFYGLLGIDSYLEINNVIQAIKSRIEEYKRLFNKVEFYAPRI